MSFTAKWPSLVSRQRSPGLLATDPQHKTPALLKTQPNLFKPFQIRSLTLKNRIVISPMCQYSATDGFFNDWHLVHLGSFAKGGAGLIITEATGVEAAGRITPWCTGIWSDDHIEPAARIVNFIHQHSAAAGIQIAHAGRKASCFPPFLEPNGRKKIPLELGGWEIVGPTQGQEFNDSYHSPVELTKDDIERVIDSFGAATVRAEKAGFDVIEIHAAHGYLLSSFHSPLTNKRTDEYGGDYEGRTRLTIQIAQRVRRDWPADKPLFLRITSTDWAEGGWSLEDTVRLAKDLALVGVDVIDCSSGGNWSAQKITAGPGYQVPFAERVRRESGVPTIAVGEITSAVQAEDILFNGRADLVAIGRQALVDPFWGLHAAKELGAPVDWPIQYEWAVHHRL